MAEILGRHQREVLYYHGNGIQAYMFYVQRARRIQMFANWKHNYFQRGARTIRKRYDKYHVRVTGRIVWVLSVKDLEFVRTVITVHRGTTNVERNNNNNYNHDDYNNNNNYDNNGNRRKY